MSRHIKSFWEADNINLFHKYAREYIHTLQDTIKDMDLPNTEAQAETSTEEKLETEFLIYQMNQVHVGVSIDMISANYNVVRFLHSKFSTDASSTSSQEDLSTPSAAFLPETWGKYVEQYFKETGVTDSRAINFFQQAINFRHSVINSLGVSSMVQIQRKMVEMLSLYLASKGVVASGVHGSDELIITLRSTPFPISTSDQESGVRITPNEPQDRFLPIPSHVFRDSRYVEEMKKIRHLISEWELQEIGSLFYVSLFRTYPIFPVVKSTCYPFIRETWDLVQETSAHETLYMTFSETKHVQPQWSSAITKYLVGEPIRSIDCIVAEQGEAVKLDPRYQLKL
jgi:hypothetical protein